MSCTWRSRCRSSRSRVPCGSAGLASRLPARHGFVPGGAHHTGFSYAVTTQHMEDFAEIAGLERCETERVFEKFYLEASRLSMRRMAARSMKASEVWTFNS